MKKRSIAGRRRMDSAARMVITGGGILVIASVIAIMLLIVREALPLFFRPEISRALSFPPETADGRRLTGDAILAAGVGSHLESAYLLDRQGLLHVFALPDGAALPAIPLTPPGTVASLTVAAAMPGNTLLLLWGGATVTATQVAFTPVFDSAGRRTINTETRTPLTLDAAGIDTRKPLLSGRVTDNGGTAVFRTRTGLAVVEQTAATDLFGDTKATSRRLDIPVKKPGNITALALDASGAVLYAGFRNGSLGRWRIEDGGVKFLGTVPASPDGAAITSMAMVFGSVSLGVGDAQGRVSTWMNVRGDDGKAPVFRKIHDLGPHGAAVTAIIPSSRDKSLLSLDAAGIVHMDHMTSENKLLRLRSTAALSAVGLAQRGNGIVGIGNDSVVHVWETDNHHPEISLTTLFGKVFYESYPAPAFVWQSSSGNDDFEPKFSITPLVFGTIKGTLYAMVFAIPLALFAAVYISQFAGHGFRTAIKPTVEIMASVPSVVIGFLAALWLAPVIERQALAVFVSLGFIPLFFIFFMVLWQRAWRRFDFVRGLGRGYEFLIVMPVLVLAVAAAVGATPLLEQLFFAGNFKTWVHTVIGSPYDQRNCIIIAFGLGFTVIPIIFSIAEDSLSNVPQRLTAAALALGASRWQTVWRVILPSASPGIFAAIMIGFGRAVGETMIVLMATGNTPIMDWSIFNGMRTLSANIAVEIPEAPAGGSLYRVLFLCSVVLFLMTFVLNTGAEIIRERLRRKYMRY